MSGWFTTCDAGAPLLEIGATWADSPQAVAAQCEAAATRLPRPPEMGQVALCLQRRATPPEEKQPRYCVASGGVFVRHFFLWISKPRAAQSTAPLKAPLTAIPPGDDGAIRSSVAAPAVSPPDPAATSKRSV